MLPRRALRWCVLPQRALRHIGAAVASEGAAPLLVAAASEGAAPFLVVVALDGAVPLPVAWAAVAVEGVMPVVVAGDAAAARETLPRNTGRPRRLMRQKAAHGIGGTSPYVGRGVLFGG